MWERRKDVRASPSLFFFSVKLLISWEKEYEYAERLL